jgi:hypothetical protein
VFINGSLIDVTITVTCLIQHVERKISINVEFRESLVVNYVKRKLFALIGQLLDAQPVAAFRGYDRNHVNLSVGVRPSWSMREVALVSQLLHKGNNTVVVSLKDNTFKTFTPAGSLPSKGLREVRSCFMGRTVRVYGAKTRFQVSLCGAKGHGRWGLNQKHL